MRIFLSCLFWLANLHFAYAVSLFGGGNVGIPLPSTQTATIQANLASTSFTIPINFIGASIELSDAIADNVYVPSNTSLINVFKALFTGNGCILRYGGSSEDTTVPPALTQAIANDIAGFTQNVGCKMHYGLDGYANNPTVAATQAGYIINAMGVGNVSFAIGNEPDLWGLGYAAYGTIFNAAEAYVLAVNSSATFEGPEVACTGCGGVIQAYQNATDRTPAQMTAVTGHYYPYGQPTAIPTFQQMTTSCNNGDFSSYTSYASNMRINESNAVAGGGLPGLNDRMASASWYICVSSILAKLGYIGYSNHNHIGSYYNLYHENGDTTWTPNPVFYGAYLFTRLLGQTIISTTNTNLDANASVIATLNSNSKANILVANNNWTTNLTFKPTETGTWSNGTVLLLNGASCAEINPTLGGSSFGEGAAWSGTTTPITNGQTVTIPPCGAALVSITS